MRYDDTAYMFSSARIRAMENRMLSAEACEKFLGARSSDDILNSLNEFGCRIITVQGPDGTRVDREASLMTMLEDAFRDVTEMLPTPEAVRFLQYKYDCNNIKSLLKCHARGVEPDGMLSAAASVPVEQLRAAVDANDFSLLPQHMAEAAALARETYLRTADAQCIDLILDRACYADMAETARASGVPFAIQYVSKTADLTNALMCLRVLRMGGDRGLQLLEQALLEGGEVEKQQWLAVCEGGETALWSFLSGAQTKTAGVGAEKQTGRTGAAPECCVALAAKCCKTSSLADCERAADAVMMDFIRGAKWLPFGAELATAYLAALEYGIKNLRIIMAGKDAGQDIALIRERLRDMYV